MIVAFVYMSILQKLELLNYTPHNCHTTIHYHWTKGIYFLHISLANVGIGRAIFHTVQLHFLVFPNI